MTWTKALFVLILLALVSAGVVAFVSRTPESVRAAAPGRAETDPSLGATFSPQDVSRNGAFRGPGYLSYALGTVLTFVTLLLLARGPVQRLADRLETVRGGWTVRVLIVAAAVTVALAVISLPLGYVRGLVVSRDWGLSTQSFGAWLTDQGRGVAIGLIFAGVTAVVYFGLVRWQPRWWWLYGWAAFSLLTVLFTFLWPLAVAPLFNKFTPLEDPALTHRILILADEAGVPLNEVLVADASKRSTAENAYVAGLGATKQLVLYDTLLKNGDENETLFVVAHELGHKVRNHVVKGLLLACAGLFFGFAALAWLSHRSSVWAWAGAGGVGDIKALPLLLAFASLAGLLTLPIQNAVSRHFESQADETAIHLTHDPDTAVRVFRRLAFSNIADLRPPQIAAWLLFTHPPIADRIEAVVAGSGSAP